MVSAVAAAHFSEENIIQETVDKINDYFERKNLSRPDYPKNISVDYNTDLADSLDVPRINVKSLRQKISKQGIRTWTDENLVVDNNQLAHIPTTSN